MAVSLLRLGRLGCVQCLQAQSWITLSRAPSAVAYSSKFGGSKKSSKKNSAHTDPVKKLFLDAIREYSQTSRATGGLASADPEYQKSLAYEIAKLQRLYGGGDLESFPEFKFSEPTFEEVTQK